MLGWAGDILNKNYATRFDGASPLEVKDELALAQLPDSGKTKLIDGKTSIF